VKTSSEDTDLQTILDGGHHPTEGGWNTRTAVWGLLLVVVVSAVFLPRIFEQNDFRTDDHYLLYLVQDKGMVLPWDEEEYMYFAAFRPLPMMSLLLDFHLYGTWAPGYYYTNLLIHAAIVVVFFLLLLQMQRDFFHDGRPLLPAFFALVIGVHADLFYNILWICNRTESMLLLSTLLFMMLALRYYRRPSRTKAVLLFLLLVAALASKSQAIALPLLFLAGGWICIRAKTASVSMKSLLLVTVALLLPVVVYVGLVAIYHSYGETLTWSMLPTKLYSMFAITSIAVHPWLGKTLYSVFHDNRMLAAIIGVVILLLFAVALYRQPAPRRAAILSCVLLYVLVLLPRSIHHIDTRINSLQIAVLLIGVFVVTLYFGRKPAMIVAVILAASHIVGMGQSIAEFRWMTDNNRYTMLLEQEDREGPARYVLLATLHRYDPYCMHFARHGRFGYDSSMIETPLRVVRKYYTRENNEYAIEPGAEGVRLIAKDSRVAFLDDTRLVSPSWLHLSFDDARNDYGYAAVSICLVEPPDNVRYLLESGFDYVDASDLILRGHICR
jgi:hypothetical protein